MPVKPGSTMSTAASTDSAANPPSPARPGDWLDNHYERWRADDAARGRLAEARTALAIDTAARERMHSVEHEYHTVQHDMGRHGPSFGR